MASTGDQVVVLIPTYQRKEQCADAVQSVLRGTVQPSEILVIDDGSTDGTISHMKQFEGPVRVVGLGENQGVSSARNRGVLASSQPWIALLDSDDQWTPYHLEKLLDHLNRFPDLRIAQTREQWFRGGLRVNQKRRHFPPEGDIFLPSLGLCLVSSSAVIVHREVFERVGAYDERMPVCEDYDLWLRIACYYHFGLVDEESVIKDGGRDDQLSRRYWGMDRFRVFSLVKLLLSGFRPEYREEIRLCALKKLKILRQGAEKRGKRGDALAYGNWIAVLSAKQSTKDRLYQLLNGDRGDDPILSVLNRVETAEKSRKHVTG
jgi:glycosyltransferase involved in cell wall biosynthesis